MLLIWCTVTFLFPSLTLQLPDIFPLCVYVVFVIFSFKILQCHYCFFLFVSLRRLSLNGLVGKGALPFQFAQILRLCSVRFTVSWLVPTFRKALLAFCKEPKRTNRMIEFNYNLDSCSPSMIRSTL